MNIKIGKIFSAILFLLATNAFATAYHIPPPDQSVIGDVKYTSTEGGDTPANIAQRYDLGFNEIESANPQINLAREIHPGVGLVVPTEHLLPSEQRRGIVINLPEMRMYYYLPNRNLVLTYPIGIGKIGKTIPIERTSITRKAKDPIWIPPQDIREFNLQQGIVLPRIMPPGPDNPLGPYAIYMRIPTYLIHSTIFPESIGKRASFGCIRMYETDIKTFFPIVERGLPVVILNSPVKVAWQANHLYMEAYQPLEEHVDAYDANLPGMIHMVNEASKKHFTLVDWQEIAFINKERDGMPHDVGIQINQD